MTAKGSRLPNREINMSPKSFINNLANNGFAKTVSKGGKVTTLLKGNTTYSVYQEATSTGSPSALMSVDGKATLKIRLRSIK